MKKIIDIIRENSQPMEPIATEVDSNLSPIPNIKALVFDVYGTLFISGSGDISLAEKNSANAKMIQAFVQSGFELTVPNPDIESKFYQAIKDSHQYSKEYGTDFPEVDLQEIWSDVIMELFQEGALTGTWDIAQLCEMATRYECSVNPIYPMPDLGKFFHSLPRDLAPHGIVSNAQFFTPFLFDAFLETPITGLGFEKKACFWSYLERKAKPSVSLFEDCAKYYKTIHDLEPENLLFVGNDCLNDIYAAQQAGWKTCLFAGDQRSLRLRQDKEHCKNLSPDCTVHSLLEINAVIS